MTHVLDVSLLDIASLIDGDPRLTLLDTRDWGLLFTTEPTAFDIGSRRLLWDDRLLLHDLDSGYPVPTDLRDARTARDVFDAIIDGIEGM